MTRTLLAAVLAVFTVWPALAAPLIYALDADASRVGFTVAFGPDKISGEVPVASADIALDFERPSQSRVSVVLDVSGARANFPFATQALRGPKILDAEAFPSMMFVSTGIETIPGEVSRALLNGDITVRGATRPLTLGVELFRPADRDLGARERLIVRLTGAIQRSDFGATGWSDLVGDAVELDMMLQIDLLE